MYVALDCLEGIDAVKVKGYNVIYYNEEVEIPYPANSSCSKGKKPEGRSFHHGRFVQKLREAAMQQRNVLVVESTANELVRNSWTGQVLGVECTTHGEKDFVSKFCPLQIKKRLKHALFRHKR